MSFLIRFWYLILLALVVSLVSAVGLLYLQREDWLPPPPDDPELADRMPGMSEEYSRWNYNISEVEDLRVKMEGERESIRKKQAQLEILEKRVRSEIEEMERIRAEITAIREGINADYIEIEEAERANVAQLSSVYTEMRPEAAVSILADLDLELVVKILSGMDEEPASRILAEMSAAPEESKLRGMAARITRMMQLVK